MMNQSSSSSFVVPSWDIIDDQDPPPLLSSITHSKPNHHHHHILPTVDYEVAELTWKDGHLGMHAFGVPKLYSKPNDNIHTLALPSLPGPVPERCSWDKPVAGGTLESIVNQATAATINPLSKSGVGVGAGGEQLVTSWFDGQPPLRIPQSMPVNAKSCLVGSSTVVGSCSVTPTLMEEGKQVRVASLTSHDWSSRVEQSISASGTILGSQDTSEREVCDTASLGSPGNTTVDDHDSVCHGRNEQGEEKKRVTVLGKRSRCAAVHNQSERKRRDKINQRMSILQKLVPNSSKTDKASMLDEVIEYMKLLQNKVDIMTRINISSMMMLPFPPLQQQQQLHMSFMSNPPPMPASINLGAMGLINHPITRPAGMPAPPPPPQGFYPNPYMPTTMASWDHNMPQSTSIPTFSAASFLASQSQPSMTMDTYSRMAAMYHQLQVPAAAATTPVSDIKGI